MSDKAFRVQCIPDSKFWGRLANSPSPKGHFPRGHDTRPSDEFFLRAIQRA